MPLPASKSIKKPKRLSRGDKVGLIAPAFHFDRERFVRNRKFLENSYGIETIVEDSVLDRQGYFAGTADRRIEEILRFITNPEIRGLIGIRGGYGCAYLYDELLNELKKLARKKKLEPKIFLGYSDLTILLNGLYQELGWITFHGPMVVGRPFFEPAPIERATFEQSLFTNKALGEITDASTVTIRPGKARGPLVGGCLALVASAVGTPYEIDTRGKILFLEDIGEAPYRVDRMLMQLKHSGAFKKIKGIVIGQMVDCKPHSESFMDVDVKRAITESLADVDVPIIYNFPAGHGTLQSTFPIGLPVDIIATKTRAVVRFAQSGVR